MNNPTTVGLNFGRVNKVKMTTSGNIKRGRGKRRGKGRGKLMGKR